MARQYRPFRYLAADVAGYSRLMAADDSDTLARLKRLRAEVIEPKIAYFHGRIVGSAGDSPLIEFASAVNAVRCAVEAQEGLADHNANLPEDRQMAFRMGFNLGDVVVDGDTIHGDGVNIAARLEKLAEPGSVCIGCNVYDQVKGKLAYAYADLGEQLVHNIPDPVHAYRVRAWKPTVVPSPAFSARDAPPLPDRPSIAVLPFTNMSGDPEQEYFADGIVEEIITALSRMRWLFVIARNSSFTYKGPTRDSRLM
jgi:class 3 adenylate cyclase